MEQSCRGKQVGEPGDRALRGVNDQPRSEQDPVRARYLIQLRLEVQRLLESHCVYYSMRFGAKRPCLARSPLLK